MVVEEAKVSKLVNKGLLVACVSSDTSKINMKPVASSVK